MGVFWGPSRLPRSKGPLFRIFIFWTKAPSYFQHFHQEFPSHALPSAHNLPAFGNPFPGELGQPIPTVRKRNALLSKIHNGYFKLLFEMMIAKNFTLW
jgi:hypothetical protein